MVDNVKKGLIVEQLKRRGFAMKRSTIRKIYIKKRQGRGYKTSRLKRPPSAKFIRRVVARKIIKKVMSKYTHD